MNEKILYSYTGIFDTPDEIIEAAEKVSKKGYTEYDINTPYPIHGMNQAMKLKPSKLGYVALVFGLSGALAAFLTIFWMMTVDYPIVIGGKPFLSFPAFVPVIFEVTVLSASIATVLTMLLVIFKFPNNSHPLLGTDYMKKVSLDKYGVSIQATDKKFDETGVKKLLTDIGAKHITPIYYDNKEINYKPQIFEPKFIGMLVLTAVIVSTVTYVSLNKLMFMTPFNWMMEQSKIIAQDNNDNYNMMQPVDGTIPRGYMPYEFKGLPELAGETLINPLQFTKKNLDLGKAKYDTYCSPCHGYFGEGDSRLRGQFPNPPSIHSEKVRTWSDGRIFHVITDGQNIMPAYSAQLSKEERWAIVLYTRALQRSLNAKESDLK